MSPTEITAVVITYNEAANISRVLEQLTWVPDVLLIDSFSTDETVRLATQFPNVRVIERKFDSFAEQCNFALKQVKTEWVLSLDSDYVLTPEFISEMRKIETSSETDGFLVSFRYCIAGRPLRACLYPPRTILYRRCKAIYSNDGHGHRVSIDGSIQPLGGKILHDDRKPLGRWLQSQDRYAALEVKKLTSAARSTLRFQDRLRLRIFPAPFAVLFYTLFVKRLILDGWPGWLYAFQRTTAELILSMHLLEWKLKGSTAPSNGKVQVPPQN